MKKIKYEYTSNELITPFNKTIDIVARERKYLAKVKGPSVESSKEFVEYIISNNYAQFIAIKNNEVIGWCDAIPYNFEGMKHVACLGMGIIQKYRGKGIGSKLISLTIEHAKNKNNIEKIELEVFKSNKKAVEFYKKHGFKIEGEKIKVRKLDGIYDNLIVMGAFL